MCRAWIGEACPRRMYIGVAGDWAWIDLVSIPNALWLLLVDIDIEILYRQRCLVELPAYTATLQPHLWSWSILASSFWIFMVCMAVSNRIQSEKKVQISKCRKKTCWLTSLGVVTWGDEQHIRLVSCRFSHLLPPFGHQSCTDSIQFTVILQQSLTRYMYLIAIHNIKGEKEYY